MKYFHILIVLFFAVTVGSCNRDELFEREQYKNELALLSDDSYNIFAEEFDLARDEIVGYVVAGCGGAHEISEDVLINLAENENILYDYNRVNFDTDESKYARKLSVDKYDIDKYQITIKAGERTGKMPVRVRANGLSPDSTYFIPLKVETFSAYEFYPTKTTVLYRVLLKNYYATLKSTTTYDLRGVRNGINVMGNKTVFPVSGNKVRIMAGNETFDRNNKGIIDAGSLVLEVAEDGHITITPWKELQVTQVDGDEFYSNTFKIEDTGYKTYKTFLLRYDYVYNGTTCQMQEELRLEFNPNKK